MVAPALTVKRLPHTLACNPASCGSVGHCDGNRHRRVAHKPPTEAKEPARGRRASPRRRGRRREAPAAAGPARLPEVHAPLGAGAGAAARAGRAGLAHADPHLVPVARTNLRARVELVDPRDRERTHRHSRAPIRPGACQLRHAGRREVARRVVGLGRELVQVVVLAPVEHDGVADDGLHANRALPRDVKVEGDGSRTGHGWLGGGVPVEGGQQEESRAPGPPRGRGRHPAEGRPGRRAAGEGPATAYPGPDHARGVGQL
mmetsp:Transcript_122243/g.346550  ORF Transcript_122243/g.346550 Transcript_122243/m.346550 type:complete len:260 (+) Transcript_122243:126-905(+)